MYGFATPEIMTLENSPFLLIDSQCLFSEDIKVPSLLVWDGEEKSCGVCSGAETLKIDHSNVTDLAEQFPLLPVWRSSQVQVL